MLRKLMIVGALVPASIVVTAAVTSVHAASTTIDIVGPVGSGAFATYSLVLPNGNFVVADPTFDGATAADIGEVSLYDGITNQLISRLTGSTANDQVGSGAMYAVGTSNFVVASSHWDGAAVDTGAVTWVDGTTGLNGAVSAANSLVGTTAADAVGNLGVLRLSNGNYVVEAQFWDNGANVDAGAIAWANGNTGLSGAVGPANSVVGSTSGDGLLMSVAGLSNENYIVLARYWDRGAIVDAGAARWASGTTGATGPMTVANSLVGASPNDHVGDAVTPLANGNYVVQNIEWANGGALGAGAATWGSGTSGVAGDVSAANSLVGMTAGDGVGSRVAALSNGNYVVGSQFWDGAGVLVDVGAVTWGNGSTGATVGAVSPLNSLVGASATDRVGSVIIPASGNGNYLLDSPLWDNGATADAGAATWVNGAAPVTGTVSTLNSLVGSHAGDQVGSFGALALPNGNFLVYSPNWTNGAVTFVGATTWINGATGLVAAIDPTNSWVGGTSLDGIGTDRAVVLSNGNFVIMSPDWHNGAVAGAGAVTWGSGSSGGHGVVDASNSVVGTTAGDAVGNGGVTKLVNGNYVVTDVRWDNGPVVDAGAVRWGDGTYGTSGPITPSNSLVGTRASDAVGQFISALNDGNYLVDSPTWDNGAIVDAGAATWENGTVPVVGNVTSANSLVGSVAGDRISSGGVTVLPLGAYAVRSPLWDNAALVDAGAATYADAGGIVGAVTTANSVLGGVAAGGAAMQIGIAPTGAGAILVGRSAENILSLLTPAPKPNFVALAPARLADTRPGLTTVDGQDAGGGLRAAGSTMELTVAGRGGVAADAAAAALNVTAVDGVVGGFVTVYPCGETRPTASNLNFPVASAVPNAVLAKLGAGGKVCLFTSQAAQLVVDVNGYFPTTSTYHSSNPARVLETRVGEVTVDGLQQGTGLAVGGSVTEVQITGRAGVPANATSVALNVTVTESVGPGFVTVFPCGVVRPTASNLNFGPGATIANLVVSKIGAGGKVCIFTQTATQLIADVNGYFPVITTYSAINPARLLETRPSLTTFDGQFNGVGFQPAGAVVTLKVTDRGGVPSSAQTVVLNVTVTQPAGGGFVTVYPCGITPPLASNLNFVANQTVANAVLVKVGTDGDVCLFTSQSTHLVADVGGYLP